MNDKMQILHCIRETIISVTCRYISSMHGGKCVFQLGGICQVLAVILHPTNYLPASEQDKERVKSKMLVVKKSAGWQEVL